MININLIESNIKGISRGSLNNAEGVYIDMSGVIVFLALDVLRNLIKYSDEDEGFIPQAHAKRKLRELIDIDKGFTGLLTGPEKCFLVGSKALLKKDIDLTDEQKRTVNDLYVKYHYMTASKKTDDIPF